LERTPKEIISRRGRGERREKMVSRILLNGFSAISAVIKIARPLIPIFISIFAFLAVFLGELCVLGFCRLNRIHKQNPKTQSSLKKLMSQRKTVLHEIETLRESRQYEMKLGDSEKDFPR
jgi:hypothetical protein